MSTQSRRMETREAKNVDSLIKANFEHVECVWYESDEAWGGEGRKWEEGNGV